MSPVQVSSLKSGLTVASIENHAPVTTLGVVIKVDYIGVIFTTPAIMIIDAYFSLELSLDSSRSVTWSTTPLNPPAGGIP